MKKGRTIGHSLYLLIAFIVVSPFIVAFVHECGHAICGIILGKTPVYMRVLWFEVYPRFALTAEMVPSAITYFKETMTGSDLGWIQLSGSLATNVVSWIAGLMLLVKKFRLYGKLPLLVVGLLFWVELPSNIFMSYEPIVGAMSLGMSVLTIGLMFSILIIGPLLLYVLSLKVEISKAFRSKRTSITPIEFNYSNP